MWNKPIKAKDRSSLEEAYAYTLRLLEFRFRGEAELREKLNEKAFTKEAVNETLQKLLADKYVDDERLLESLIRSNREVGLYGPQYIKQKLLQRKFTREQIAEALPTFYTQEDEFIVAEKYFRKQKGLDLSIPKEKQKLLQKFFRRGFSPSVVFKVLGQASSED